MSADELRRPSFQFYPDDWLSDMALKRCSLAAKGLWVDMLSYMHSGAPYGHLTVGGRAITVDEIARMVGASVATVRRLLAELEAAGVPSKTEDGTFYSRRMVRDERNRQVRAAGGVKSLEHPNVPRPKDRPQEGRPKGPSEGYPSPPSFGGSPSSSSLSSSSKESTDPVAPSAPTLRPMCAEPSNGSAPLVDFQTVGTKGKTWGLSAAQLADWREAYPSVDVLGECQRARAWLDANPDRRKTAPGMPRFLVNWLNRAVDRGPARSGTPPRRAGRTGPSVPGKYAGVEVRDGDHR